MTASAAPEPSGDPGLQRERTSLAWRRTILSMAVADLFIWRGWLASLNSAAAGLEPVRHAGHSLGLGICAAVAAATTVVLTSCAVARQRELRGPREGLAAAPAVLLLTAASAVVALAAAAVVAILLG